MCEAGSSASRFGCCDVALNVIAIGAVLVGVPVYLVGADQARSYLNDLRIKGGDLIEKVNTSRDLIETAE